MIARAATPNDIRHVVLNMRAWNKRELFATSFDEPNGPGLWALASRLINLQHDSGIKGGGVALLTDAGTPAALVFAWRGGYRAAIVGMAMTDEWPKIGKAAFRYLKRSYIPEILVPNVDIAETRVMVGRDTKWLKRLGFVRTSQPIPRGKNGETFVDLTWFNDAAFTYEKFVECPRLTWPERV